MSTSEVRNIGQAISVRRGGPNAAVTAGGAGDNTAVTGVIIDRFALGTPQSLVAAILWTATLAASQTLQIAWTLQHSEASDMSGAATLATATTIVATGVGTFSGELEANIALMGARRYLRLNFTPDLSASGTDTAALASALVFGGADRLPQ